MSKLEDPPFNQQFSHYNSNPMEISFSYPNIKNVAETTGCAHHDSIFVVACAKCLVFQWHIIESMQYGISVTFELWLIEIVSDIGPRYSYVSFHALQEYRSLRRNRLTRRWFQYRIKDVLLWVLLITQSTCTGCWNGCIAFKFVWRLRRMEDKLPLKFQSNW